MKNRNHMLPINPMRPIALANPVEFDGIAKLLTTDRRLPTDVLKGD